MIQGGRIASIRDKEETGGKEQGDRRDKAQLFSSLYLEGSGGESGPCREEPKSREKHFMTTKGPNGVMSSPDNEKTGSTHFGARKKGRRRGKRPFERR